VASSPRLPAAIVTDQLGPAVVGMDPFLVRDVRRRLWELTDYQGSTGLTLFGISAIDVALSDLMAKALDVPVWRLLGAARSSIPAYAMVGWLELDLDGLTRVCTTAMEQGFKGVKMKVGGAGRHPDRGGPGADRAGRRADGRRERGVRLQRGAAARTRLPGAALPVVRGTRARRRHRRARPAGATARHPVATLRALDQTSFIGVAMIAWCSGSVVGGLVYGGLRRRIPPWLLLLGLCLLTVVVGFAREPWQLAVLLIPAGALVAPLITSTVEGVTRVVPERRRGEAMGWHGSALTIGVAAGSPFAGAVIDATAPWFGFVAVGVLGVAMALACGVIPFLTRRRRVGELRPSPPAFSEMAVADDATVSPQTPEQPVAAVSTPEARR